MNHDKILEAARANKNRGMEYENKEISHSNLLSSFIAILVAAGLFFIEYFINNTVNVGLIAVGMVAVCVQYLYTGFKLKKLIAIIAGIISAVIAILFIIAFVIQVVES